MMADIETETCSC